MVEPCFPERYPHAAGSTSFIRGWLLLFTGCTLLLLGWLSHFHKGAIVTVHWVYVTVTRLAQPFSSGCYCYCILGVRYCYSAGSTIFVRVLLLLFTGCTLLLLGWLNQFHQKVFVTKTSWLNNVGHNTTVTWLAFLFSAEECCYSAG